VYKNKTFLAIIPARSGSKRLPGKNTLDLNGKPLIVWTIEAALKSKYIDKVFVSTDDQGIADISEKYGANVPFLRPDILATDESNTISTVLYLLNELDECNEKYSHIILLQPTSPLRTTKDIDNSIELLQDSDSDAVVSVCEAEHSPLWCNKIPKDGDLSNFLDESVLNKRSQDLDTYYRLNGSIYLCNIKRLLKEKTFLLKSDCIAYKMKQERSIDIDNKLDLLQAEAQMKYSQGFKK
jgi:CMP-N,N'-diacetyllegionaminic acid synthase